MNNSTTTEEPHIFKKSSRTTTTVATIIVPEMISSTTQKVEIEKPVGIKIKEITKPEEIRITDNKPKPFKPSFAQNDYSSTTELMLNDEMPNDSSKLNELTSESSLEKLNASHEELTPLENIDDDDDLTSGTKNVRQTDHESTESVDVNKAQLIVATTAANTDSSSTTVSNIFIVDGEPIEVIGAVGLQRGEDEILSSTTEDTPLTEMTTQSMADICADIFKTVADDKQQEFFRAYTPDYSTETDKDFWSWSSTQGPTDEEIIAAYEKEQQAVAGSNRKLTLTSAEIISQYEKCMESKKITESDLIVNSMDPIFATSNQAENTVHPEDSTTVDRELDVSQFDVSSVSSNDLSSTQMIQQNVSTTTTENTNEELPSDNRDPAYPEQPEDISIHSSMSETTITNDSLSDTIKAFPDSQERSPGEPLLIPEWERNHTAAVATPTLAAAEVHTTAGPPSSAEVHRIESSSSTTESYHYEQQSSDEGSTVAPEDYSKENNVISVVKRLGKLNSNLGLNFFNF